MRKVATIPSPTDDILRVMTYLNDEGAYLFLYAFGHAGLARKNRQEPRRPDARIGPSPVEATVTFIEKAS